jgi:hypothetical protein
MFETIKMRDVIKACGLGNRGTWVRAKGGESKGTKVKQVNEGL